MIKLIQNKLLLLCLLSIFMLSFYQEAQAQFNFDEGEIVDLPPAKRDAFIKSVDQKVWYLQHYISKISDKTIPIEERLEMIDSAVKLFSNENNTIQVSNAVTGEKNDYPVRLYFRRLANINASRVDITFYQGTVLERLTKGTDGYFYGTAIMYQLATIYKGPEIEPYKDKTIKRVNFKSKQELTRVGDKSTTVMETLLENISVKETMAQ